MMVGNVEISTRSVASDISPRASGLMMRVSRGSDVAPEEKLRQEWSGDGERQSGQHDADGDPYVIAAHVRLQPASHATLRFSPAPALVCEVSCMTKVASRLCRR